MRLYLDPRRDFPLVLLPDRQAVEQRARAARRRKKFRAVTVAVRDVTQTDRQRARRRMKALRLRRPRVRRSCLPGGWNSARPCPFVGCRHHLYLDINPDNGSITVRFPNLYPWELEESCSLDVAERGGMGIPPLAPLLAVSRQGVHVQVRRALGDARGNAGTRTVTMAKELD